MVIFATAIFIPVPKHPKWHLFGATISLPRLHYSDRPRNYSMHSGDKWNHSHPVKAVQMSNYVELSKVTSLC